MTRRQLCELIQRRIANGDVPNDFKPALEELNYWIEHGVAYAASKNYSDSVSLEVDFVSDSFYARYTNISLSKESITGEYYSILPTIPYGLPRGFDITSVTVSGGNGINRELTRVNQNQLTYFRRLPQDINMAYYWIIGKYIYVYSQMVLDNKTISIVMASTGSANSGLDIELNCPPDVIPVVVDYVVRQFIQPTQIDNSNDGVQKK